jgi:hypothetical protein
MSYIVIRINQTEKYVSVICGGSYEECSAKAQYFNDMEKFYKRQAIMKGEHLSDNTYKVMDGGLYGNMMSIEAYGGKEVYEQMFGS